MLGRVLVGLRKLLAQSDDVVIAHTHYAIALCLLVAPRRVRVVAVHHWPEDRYPLLVRLVLFCFRKTDRLAREIYVSDAVARGPRSTVIPNPVPSVEMRLTRECDVLVVARHSVEKSVETAVRALPLLPSRELSLIGTGALTRQLEDLAAELEVSDRVRFLGPLPHADVLAYMAGCECLVLPSEWEAMPMVLLEGAAVGAAMVVSDIPAHRFFVQSGAARPFRFGDPADLAATVNDARNRRASLHEGVRGLRERLSEERIATLWRNVIATRGSVITP